MAVVTQYADRKAELEEQIKVLESERTTLLSDIASLKERLTTLELERHSSSLQSEVEALRTEKAVLEEKVGTYTAEESTGTPASSSEGYQV